MAPIGMRLPCQPFCRPDGGLIESCQELVLPKAVALELEWVLQVFEQLLDHPYCRAL